MDTFKEPELKFLKFYICPLFCTAFVGFFEQLTSCPYCHSPRFTNRSDQIVSGTISYRSMLFCFMSCWKWRDFFHSFCMLSYIFWRGARDSRWESRTRPKDTGHDFEHVERTLGEMAATETGTEVMVPVMNAMAGGPTVDRTSTGVVLRAALTLVSSTGVL